MTFNSRRHAGRLLAEELNRRGVKPDLVYGLARGGVAVAAEIAAGFKVPLDPLVVRKISPPADPEFAVGAIAAIDCRVVPMDIGTPRNDKKSFETGSIFVWWDKDIVRRLGLSADWQKQQIKDKKTEISNYLTQLNFRKNYTRSGQSLRKIILVDDGAATGATMLAAIEVVRNGFETGVSPTYVGETPDKNQKIIVALPIASTEAAAKIKHQADEAVILSIDPDFRAVGQYYREFNQVSWDEVKTLLQLNREAYRKTYPRQAPPQHDRSRVGDKRGGFGANIRY